MKQNRFNTLTNLLFSCVLLCTTALSYAESLPAVGPIIVDSITQIQPRCGLDNGSVTIYARGSDHIFYSIDNGLTYQEDSIFVNLGIGDYSIRVTDGLACVLPYTVQLTNGPQVEIAGIGITCHEQSVSGDIDLEVENGIAPFSYYWEGPNNYSSTNQNLLEVSPGIYKVTITDAVGCTAEDVAEIPICCGMSQGLNLYCPSDLYLECGNPNNDQLIQNWLSSVSAYDGINNQLNVTNNYNNAQNTFCEDILTVRFFTRDQCDNTTDCTADILIADISTPILYCPADVTLDFVPGENLNNIEAWLNSATASDNCSGAYVINDFDLNTASIECEENSIFNVNFTALDQCSNSDQCSAKLTIAPAPEVQLVCIENLEVYCDDNNIDQTIWSWINDVRAQDNTGKFLDAENDFVSQTIYNCGDELEVNFLAYDYCGNILTCTGVISIIDSEAPIINCDNHLNISAYDDNKLEQIENWLASIEAVDNCSETEIINNFNPSELNYACGIADTKVVKFEATDLCGNSEICLLSINIIASEIQISVPDPLEISCNINNQIEIQQWLKQARAVDQFGQEFELNNDYINQPLNCTNHTQVNFNYQNPCGEQFSSSSSIILVDNQGPQISCPEEFSIMSFELPTFDFEAWLNEFTAVDLCSEVTISNDFNYAEFDGSCKEEQIVHFQAVDQCGNISECEVHITISDFAYPEVMCPDDIYLDTSDPFVQDDLNAHFEKIVSNTNSNLNFEYSEQINFDRLDLLHESKIIEVVITATNECNESHDCSFMIYINSEAQIFAPSVFSPNGDGENDRFTIFGNNHLVSIIELSIYDRLGNRIDYLTNVPINHPSLGWDGTFRGRPCEIGVYSYHALIRDLKGNEVKYVGTITLVR